MKVPDDAWLEFRVRPLDDRRSELVQTAYFRPSPLWGRLYWYALYPLHNLIFRGMARNIARAARARPPRSPRCRTGRRRARPWPGLETGVGGGR